MANFPSNPNIGDEYTSNGIKFQWDGEKWSVVSRASKSQNIVLDSTSGFPEPTSYAEGTELQFRDTLEEFILIRSPSGVLQWVEKGNVGDEVDVTAASHLTLAQAQASDLKVGQYVRLTDRGLGLNKLVPLSETGGAYIEGMQNNLKLRLEELDELKPSMFGSMTTPTERTAALTACLNFATLTNGYYISLPNGVYDPINITQSDVLIVTSGKPVFTLPANTVTAVNTTPTSAVTISGDNVKIYGDVYTDGNSVTNDSSGYNLSNRIGEFHVAGDCFELHGTLNTLDAHYVGVSLGDEVNQALQPYIERIINHKSASYLFSAWNTLEWTVGGIINKDEVQAFNNRVYTGNESLSSKLCARGHIGYILGRGTYCVFEIHTLGLHVGYMDIAGWKAENTVAVRVGSARSEATEFDAWGFGVTDSEDFHADSITVNNYQGLQQRAVQIFGSSGSIGRLKIDNNQASVDIDIYTVPDNFTIVDLDLNGRNGTPTGLRMQSGYVRNNLTIVNLNSKRHTSADVEIAVYDPDNIKLLNVNSDINISAAYDLVKRRNVYKEGVDNVGCVAAAGIITVAADNDTLSWTQTGRSVTLSGRLIISSTTGSGSLRIAALDSIPSDLPDASGEVPVALQIEGLTGAPAGIIQAKIPEGSSEIIVTRYDAGVVYDDVANYLQAGSRITLSATYNV